MRIAALVFLVSCAGPTALRPDVGRIADAGAWRVVNAEPHVAAEDGKRVLRLAPIGGNRKGSNIAIALVAGLTCAEATIDVDLRGQGEANASFIGIAFGVSDADGNSDGDGTDALFEGGTRPLQFSERALPSDDSIAVHLCQDAQNARRLAHLPEIRSGKEEPQVAALSQLVDVDQPGAQLGAARRFLLLEVLHPLAVPRQLGGDLCAVGHDLAHFLGLDLALDLKLPKVAEQRALLSGQPVGFLLECLQPFGRALGEGLRARAVCRLGQ